MDKRLLEILADKPDLVADFPEWMLPASTLHEIRETDNVAVAEIAGRDSVAAAIKACDLRTIKAIVPTVAYTGTEYGRWRVPFEKINVLKKRLAPKKIKLYRPVILGAPRFWWKLCGRYATHLSGRFGFYSHCLGCHLYFHALRIPLARKLCCNIIIGGERESHDGKIKINQTGIALDAYTALMKKYDIDLFLPIRYVTSGEEIEKVLGQHWPEGEQQLECVLSKNYQEVDGSVSVDEGAVKGYFDEFALKTVVEIIEGYLQKLK